MNSLRKHLTYANVVATLALVFAMSGSAIAAKHYLITSTSQISPKVLKKLKAAGRTGKRGPSGSQGVTGAQGAAGSQGIRGPEGPKGVERPKGVEGKSPLSQLPPGVSESGVYGIAAARSNGGHIAQAITFPIPLTSTISVSNVLYTETATPIAHCSGPGHADPGFLCIYSSGIAGLTLPELVDPESGEVEVTTGQLGFGLIWKSTSTKGLGEEESDFGTYTVTAP
jgi:hypothetical protein